jgi:hypothetical protein
LVNMHKSPRKNHENRVSLEKKMCRKLGRRSERIADMKIKDITEWSEHRGKLFVKYAYARYNDAQEIGNVTENVLTFRN